MDNRIEISRNAFLLFAELINYLHSERKSYEDLDDILKKSRDEICDKTKEAETKKKYLFELGKQFRNRKSVTKSSFYQKIKTSESLQKLKFNAGSPLYHFFDNYVKRYYPLHAEVKKGIKEFCEGYLNSYFEPEGPSRIQESESGRYTIDKDLLDSVWYLYYNEYEPINCPKNSPYSFITKLVLHFKNKNEICLYDRDEQLNFVSSREATVIDGTSSIMIINLEREHNTSKKNLELRIILSSAITETSIFLGQYMDFETGDRIVSGSLVLQKVASLHEELTPETTTQIDDCLLRKIEINGKSHDIAQAKLAYHSSWRKHIPNQIAFYLCDKWKNFTKTTSRVSNLGKLTSFINDQGDKRFSNPKYNAIIEYDAMLLTPGFDDIVKDQRHYDKINRVFFKEEYPIHSEGNNEDIKFFQTKDLLSKVDIHKIFFPQRMYKISFPNTKTFKGREEPGVMLKYYQSIMQSCRSVILIMPDKICSSTLLMIGWAMQMEKLLFIFPTKKNILPRLISKDYQSHIKVSDKIAIKDIPSYIRLNGGLLLDRDA